MQKVKTYLVLLLASAFLQSFLFAAQNQKQPIKISAPIPECEAPLGLALTAAINSGNFMEYAAGLRKAINQRLPHITDFSLQFLKKGAIEKKKVELQAIPNDPLLVRMLLQERIFHYCGVPVVNKVAATPQGKVFLKWLLANTPAMLEFTLNGPPDSWKNGKGDVAIHHDALPLFCKLWTQQNAKERAQYQKLAVAIALVFDQPRLTSAKHEPIDPVARYHWFRNADEQGKLLSCFKTETVFGLRHVVDAARSEDELNFALKEVPKKFRSAQKIAHVAYHVHYRPFNSKGVSVQNGSAYYEYHPITLQIYKQYGGVCGAISKFGSAVSRANGVPSFTVGQPGHCAFVCKTDAANWRLKNPIKGWDKTTGAHQFNPWNDNGEYIPLVGAMLNDLPGYRRSELLVTAAECLGAKQGAAQSRLLFEEAAKISPLNYGAWLGYLSAQPKDKAHVQTTIKTVFAKYKLPQKELLKRIP